MFKEDMVSDGVENCVQYIDNFDPTKSKNPFAYFTQIVYFAFLRRIAKEKRQMDIRDKLIEKNGYEQVFHSDTNDDSSNMNSIKSRIETNMRN
jgi:DNA-directed RNA polymerase specialized sigma24 family protein